jgi:hypothetical protein
MYIDLIIKFLDNNIVFTSIYMDLIKHPSITLINAPPRSGKSTLLKYLICDLFANKQFAYGIVICPTIYNGGYDFLPNAYLYQQYSDAHIVRLFRHQMRLIKQNGSAPAAFLILDDCLGSVKWNSQLLIKIITTYRHYNVSILITAQYLLGHMTPTLRNMTEYYFTFKPRNLRDIKSNFEEFFMEFENEKKLQAFFTKHLSERFYFCLVKCSEEDPNKKFIISKSPLVRNTQIRY